MAVTCRYSSDIFVNCIWNCSHVCHVFSVVIIL
jgi:hypothetical protein